MSKASNSSEVTVSSQPLQIGIVQATALPGEVERNLETLRQSVTRAARGGAVVVVTPELFATGYDPAEACRHDGARIREEIAEIAAQADVALVASTVDSRDGSHFISASLFTPEGTELQRVHKRHLYGSVERRHFTPGATYGRAVEWRGIRWGMGICYDVEFPEFGRSQAVQGAEVILVPTAVPVLKDPGPPKRAHSTTQANRYDAAVTSTLQVPVRALENGVYIAYANHVGPGFTGLSCIATPAGQHAALMDASTAGVSVAPVDPGMVAHSRALNTYLEDLER